MKRYLIILSGILLSINLFAENFKILSDSAMNHYLNNDYENALKIYDSIYQQSYSSADLFYNMGNCHYKLGDIANSIYFYEKALVIQPNDKDIQHNLGIANLSLKNKVEQLPEIFYISWYNKFISLISSDGWAILSIILFITSLILFGLFLFSKKIVLRKTGFIVGIIFFISSLCTLIFSRTQAKKITDNHYAIIFESSMVKSSPGSESHNLFEIDEGLKVFVKDSVNSWINIRLADGKEGWIPAENLKKI